MEWIKRLRGAVIGLDTAPLIYFIEESDSYIPLVKPFFEAVDRGEFRVVTSVLTLTEVLVHPMRRGDSQLAAQYRSILLQADGITTLPVSKDVAEEAARLRGKYGLRTPDAVQIATALWWRASFFLTNDTRLPDLPGLKMLVLDRLVSRS